MPVKSVVHTPALVERPLYSYAQADVLASLSRGTARRWLTGYSYRDAAGSQRRRPAIAFRRSSDTGEAVSFLQLVELVAIGGLKRRGFTMAEIRRVVAFCQERLDTFYPLASLKFKLDGHDIFVDRGSHLLSVLHRQGAQAWHEVLGPFLASLDYEDTFARRWWPCGKQGAIVIDPDFGFGMPVVAGSGIRTEIIAERIETGESAAQVAADFNISAAQVEAAREFERTQHAA